VRDFARWCAAREMCALPCSPATLACFLADRASAGLKPSSLSVAIAALVAHHRAAGVPAAELPSKHPQVQEVWAGIRRTLGVAPRRVAPVAVDELARMYAALNDTMLIGMRDRALLVCGFAAALRRSELAALDVEHIRFTREGVVVHLAHSKTDQERAGVDVGLPFGSVYATCPVRTLRAWLDASGMTSGALFRSISRHGRLGDRIRGRDVARVVQRTAAAAGLDRSLYSGHSLRSGLATAAAKAGKSDRSIMAQGRWTGRSMVDRYVRGATLLDGSNAASGIGL
jgi:site-specific recombinase XerC